MEAVVSGMGVETDEKCVCRKEVKKANKAIIVCIKVVKMSSNYRRIILLNVPRSV